MKIYFLQGLFACIIVFSAQASWAAGDHDDFYEMKLNGDQFWSIMESLPYAAEGDGPVMYVFEYSECPYCQAMYRDFANQDLGLELRKVFVPVNEKTGRESVALGQSRDIADYHAFMQRRKAAPNFTHDSAAIALYNSIIRAANEDLPVILTRNGWPLDGISYPQYAWRENGRIFTNAGYSKPSFSKAIARAVAGGSATVATTKSSPAPGSQMTRRNPSLEQADIQKVRLGMPLEEVHAVLTGSGWTRQPAGWVSKGNNSTKKMFVKFAQLGSARGGARTIRYTQQFDRSASTLDAVRVRDALIAKYGVPDEESARNAGRRPVAVSDPAAFVTLTYKEYTNVPRHAEAVKLCKAYLSEHGYSTLLANQKAGGFVVLPSVQSPLSPVGLQRMQDNCPDAVGWFYAMQESMIAPTLTATISAPGATMTVEATWERGQFALIKAQRDAALAQQKNRSVVEEVDL